MDESEIHRGQPAHRENVTSGMDETERMRAEDQRQFDEQIKRFRG